jgi:deazaflavin-dependent oxidoreductase (nitroreductase family)
VIVASKGGADSHPAWYLNIAHSDEVEFQVATQAFRASWREPEYSEREKLWNIVVDNYPFYADYQASTERQIPLVVMRPVKEIPVFRAEDATGVRQL